MNNTTIKQEEKMPDVKDIPEILEKNQTTINLKPELTREDFGKEMCHFANNGVRIMGGCCGTTPDYIKELVDTTKSISPISNIKFPSFFPYNIPGTLPFFLTFFAAWAVVFNLLFKTNSSIK